MTLLARRYARRKGQAHHRRYGAGRRRVQLPFGDGVTGILLDARTYQFAGYVNGGAQTLLLRQAHVCGPGVRP